MSKKFVQALPGQIVQLTTAQFGDLAMVLLTCVLALCFLCIICPDPVAERVECAEAREGDD